MADTSQEVTLKLGKKDKAVMRKAGGSQASRQDRIWHIQTIERLGGV